MQSNIVVATRVHRASSTSLADVSKIKKFIDQCKSYSNGLIICIDIKESLEDTLYFTTIFNEVKSYIVNSDSITKYDISVIPISTWGNFTFALNAALYKAIECKYDYIIFQSIEFRTIPLFVRKLEQEILIPHTLVVGQFMNGHEFFEGDDAPLRGRTCPWNTMAIWNISFLGLTGFPMIGDGMGEDWGGVEEVSAVALQQLMRPSLRAVLIQFNIINDDDDDGRMTRISPERMEAITTDTDEDKVSNTITVATTTTTTVTSTTTTTTVTSTTTNNADAILASSSILLSSSASSVPSSSSSSIQQQQGEEYISLIQELQWDTNFHGDEVRQAYHEKKMMSKDSRPQKQLEKLGISPTVGRVCHIDMNIKKSKLLQSYTSS